MRGYTAAVLTIRSHFTQCYVSFGDSDGEDFAFTKCNDDGNFTIANLPDGIWRITVFDRWNDQIVDGLSTPVFPHWREGHGYWRCCRTAMAAERLYPDFHRR